MRHGQALAGEQLVLRDHPVIAFNLGLTCPRHRWRSHQAAADEAMSGLAGSFARRTCEPAFETAEVHGGSREHVMEMCLGEPDVAGPAQVHGAGAE